MLTDIQAKAAVEQALPGAKVEDWISYREVFLFRVQFPSASEANYDPFFYVDKLTGEVRDFSVLTDGNISEIAALFAKSTNRQ